MPHAQNLGVFRDLLAVEKEPGHLAEVAVHLRHPRLLRGSFHVRRIEAGGGIKTSLAHIQTQHLRGLVHAERPRRHGGQSGPKTKKTTARGDDHLDQTRVLHVGGDELDPAEPLVLHVPDFEADELREALRRTILRHIATGCGLTGHGLCLDD